MAIGSGISLRGINHEDWMYPFNLKAGIVKADEGKAVTLDTTANNQVKLAGDGDPILGRLEVVEDRTQEGVLVGTVNLKGGMKFPLEASATVAVGDAIVGSGVTPGSVKAVALTLTEAFGTANATLADVGGSFSQATLNDNFADIVAKLNLIANMPRSNIVVEVGSDFVIAIVK